MHQTDHEPARTCKPTDNNRDADRPRASLLAIAALVLIAAAGVSSGCAGAQATGPTWPTVNVLPAETPDDLETDAPTSMLRRGPDGHLFVVGGFGDRDIESGATFVARYSGEWPVDSVERPALAAGRVVNVLDDEIAIAHLTYQMPDTEVGGLELDWEADASSVGVGKGILTLRDVRDAKGDSDNRVATLETGQTDAVQGGDVYAILRDPADTGEQSRLQLSQRLEALCLIRDVQEDRADCHLYRTEKGVGASPKLEQGQHAVFLEHDLQAKPAPGIIQVAGIQGDNAPKGARRKVVETIRRHIKSTTAANAKVETIDQTFDATDPNFHRRQFDVEYRGKAQILVGLSTEKRNDQTHLIANYTGVGPASGPGMVAAPPTGGVSLGPVSRLNENRVNGFAVVAWSGLMVYRGQTHQALLQLHYLLSHPYLQGPLRWHARDQYAMRWAALGHLGESLWLVEQDEAIGTQNDDRMARLNAMGTRVRLHDMLDRPERALEAARNYLDDYSDQQPNSNWLSAVGMLAEMLAANEQYDAIPERIEQLRNACPDGCGGDLFVYLANIFWSVSGGDAEDLTERLTADLLELGEQAGGARLADARRYQAAQLLREREFDQALIGFLEAERLYEEIGHTPGRATSLYFQMLAHAAQKSHQKAFDTGKRALELQRQLRDFGSMTRTLNRLSGLFSNVTNRRPQPYFRRARPVLSKAVSASLASGDIGQAAATTQTMGEFLLKFGHSDEVKQRLQQAVQYSLAATRFDVAATSHFLLAIVARREQNRAQFQREIEMARTMAKLSGDEQLQRAIDQALDQGSSEDSGEDPTELL